MSDSEPREIVADSLRRRHSRHGPVRRQRTTTQARIRYILLTGSMQNEEDSGWLVNLTQAARGAI
ncbi:MAG TPA: hypothetical protein VMM78_07105 [Thermomicrobiales bacterium]|nr:hypothetical protein [Thermomicrobiales bacterium]